MSMENSFTGWEVEGSNDKKTNASLAEQKYLSHLVTLDIEVPDAKLLPKGILFENLIRFKIFIGDVWSCCENCETIESLKLNKLNTSLHSMDGISKLLKRAKDLYLSELSGANHVLSELDREGFPALKHFHVESSPKIQYIMHSVEQVPGNPVFPALESLYLTKLINLQEVCHGQLPPGSFGYLRIVKVDDCDGIKCLFSISLARSLPQLQEIEIKRCRVMDVVEQYGKELKDGSDVADTILFPQLRSLTFQHLPKLLNFCSEVKALPSIYVSMKELRSTQVKSEGICLEGEPGTHILLSNKQEIWHCQIPSESFGNLHSLHVENCASLLKFLPSFLLSSLQNLEVVILKNRDLLEEVFDLEGSIS
ncbi:uncharacterized protein LOC117930145 isoform X5 [Vitis riparia]|uniref:uncharacterized protein LOC117930145 isoform X5 n=1 Tax=Vitis riparia TaxID=96939 RepID=UPI00155AD58E|nr:uncharacterized protein LOC117930145 isoform X5 [Vitis riparia]